MGCMIVFVILLVIGIGILCFLTGDMTAFIALAATLVIGLGLAGILYHIYKSKQRRMEKYNPLSPTLRWMNAAGSILIAASQHTNFHLLAGWRYNNEFDRESIKTMLWDYWGIQGHETAIKEMRSLIDEGMRASYRRKMELLSHKYKDATEVQLIEEARKTNPKADEDSYLPKMLTAWRRYGENALLGWDMGRCAYITQCCYLAGYINMKEMLDLCVDAGTKAQAFFQNWEEMMESYLLGGQFWKHEDQSNPNSMTAERWKLYEQLWQGRKPFQSSPYLAVPFDQPLSKEVITRNIIIMDSSYSVLGMRKARPVCRALVGGVRFSVSGWTKCPEVGACSAICCFLLSSHLKSVQNCLDKYKRSQNIHKNLDAHQYYN
nr:DUF1266 domain-containing protein [uncultured Anaerostipes sp.]